MCSKKKTIVALIATLTGTIYILAANLTAFKRQTIITDMCIKHMFSDMCNEQLRSPHAFLYSIWLCL